MIPQLILPWVLWLLGPKALTLKVDPRVCSARCDIRVRVQVTPNADNRVLIVRVSGDNYEGASETQLDGEAAPFTQPYFWFKSLPEGHYVVDAFVQTSLAVVAHEAQSVEVF